MAKVYDYRRHVNEGVAGLLADCPADACYAVVERMAIGINHEQQHQELLVTDIKHNLAYNPLRPAYRADLPAAPMSQPEPLRFVACEGGIRSIGADPATGFACDNEYPRHDALLAPYRLADRLTTTVSSCAGRWCCGAVPARRRGITSVPAIETSSSPVSAGSSRVFGWRRMQLFRNNSKQLP